MYYDSITPISDVLHNVLYGYHNVINQQSFQDRLNTYLHMCDNYARKEHYCYAPIQILGGAYNEVRKHIDILQKITNTYHTINNSNISDSQKNIQHLYNMKLLYDHSSALYEIVQPIDDIQLSIQFRPIQQSYEIIKTTLWTGIFLDLYKYPIDELILYAETHPFYRTYI